MHAKVRDFFHTARVFSVLPVSMLPFLAFLFVVAGVHGVGVRLHGGTKPWKAPAIRLTSADLQYKPPPIYSPKPCSAYIYPCTGGIPVLLYHGINYLKTDADSMTPEQFATEMAFLQHLGYHTISIYQYIDWREGRNPQLPSRPILLTFDDGRFDAYRGADLILKKYHMQATMYVIVNQETKSPHNPYYLTWEELKKMQASGRWGIQFHADNGHVLVPRDAQGALLTKPTPQKPAGICGVSETASVLAHCGPFYATREWLAAKGRIETMAEYTARVETDIQTGLAIMRKHGFTDLKTMAMPFGEYGQTTRHNGEYDLAVEQELTKIMPHYFVSIMVQSIHPYTPYSIASERAIRLVAQGAYPGTNLQPYTTLAALYRYLRQGDPTVIAGLKQTCGSHFKITSGAGATCVA